MGYSVVITPVAGRRGLLKRGNLAPAWSIGTYYHHPSSARRAALSWLSQHPGGKAEIIKFKDKSVIESYG